MQQCDEMRELKFDMRFAPLVLDGDKRNTIRRDTNLTVGECVKLVSIEPIVGGVEHTDLKVVMITSILLVMIDYESRKVWIYGMELAPEQIKTLFYDNGWASVDEGFEYYKSMYGPIFEGVNIQWD